MKYYKLLNDDGTTPITGFQWPMPKRGKPGEWLTPIKGELRACYNGYHVMKIEDVLDWRGKVLVEVEIKGRPLRDTNKSVVRNARTVRVVKSWNDKNLRLFAADCAERVLPIWEKKYPKDDRPRKAIHAARAFAKGKISFKAMRVAAAAAYAYAAYAAADAATYAAAYAYAAYAAADAATYAAAAAADAAAYAYAAADAATYAAYAAAAAAARKKEKKWQIKRLKEYLI